MDNYENINFFKSIQLAKQFPSMCLMITGVPSHSTEGEKILNYFLIFFEDEIEKKIRKVSKKGLGKLILFLSRREGLETNEGFGYILVFSNNDLKSIKALSLIVKKQKIRFKEPTPIHLMREYLVELKQRQVHVSGLGRKIDKGKTNFLI